VYPQERSSLAREKVTMLVRARSNSNWEKKCFRVSFFGSNKTQNYIARAYRNERRFGRIFEFHAFLSLIIIIIIATD